jgi:integrase
LPRNRSLPPHLEIRKTGFYWRRRLPLSPRDGRAVSCGLKDHGTKIPTEKSFLCFSLRTHVPRDAKIMARRLTEMSDLVFAADAEMTMAIARETQARLLESLARFEIEAFERSRALAGPRSSEAATMELRREEALQTTLRMALHLGDREVARHPLRHVAAQLGIKLDEADEDWTVLAYETTKVLLDVSQERGRRQQGLYDPPTVFFRRAIATSGSTPAVPAAIVADAEVAPASFASVGAVPAPACAAASFVKSEPVATSMQAAPSHATTPEMQTTIEPPATAAKVPQELVPSTPPAKIVVPAGLDLPDGYDEESWQEARIAARPPRILIDRKLLSEGSRAALEKPRGITLVESIELFYELLSLGYKAPFNKHQKRKKIPDHLKDADVADRLCEDHRGKRRLALDYWPAALGDEPVDEIPVDDVNDALERFWRVPANHGKSERDRGKYNLIELIEKADAKQAQVDKDIAAETARGSGSEVIDKMRLEGHEARISVTTYIKHGRVLRAVGEMLMDMQLIDQNPFSICTWSNKEEKALKSSQGERRRQAWDDRIDDLFGSPIYQEPLKDVGDPLFWSPLIARFQGMRMEEILQLGPDDFGTDKGIPYLEIRHTIINGVKTLSSARRLPIHPQLIELGLMKLADLRRKEGRIRLFPTMNRGKQKGTFSANFSKNFAYYRRTNDCYWPGLDFHALRTTFHHDLLGDDKSDAIRCRLMGHTYTDEGDRSYGQNLGIDKLAERMKSVVVDISMIRRPFDAPSAIVNARAKERGLRVVG